MLEKRQQWLHHLEIKIASDLALVPEDERPNWPSLADMETLSKRQWEAQAWQLRANLRKLFLRKGFVLSERL